MGTRFGFQNIVTDGLVFSLDSYNQKSYVSGNTDTYNLVSNNVSGGTLVNGVGFSEKEWTFDGVSEVIETDYSLLSISEISFECWVNLTTLPTGGSNQYAIAAQWYFNDANRVMSFRIADSTTIRINNNQGTGSLNSDLTIPALEADRWYHMIWTFNSGNGEFFMDGNKIGDFSGLHATTNTTSLATFNIGGGTTFGFSNVTISNVRLYDRPLSLSDAIQNYNSTKWRFQ
jgi:hypothetical protein